MAEKKLRLGEVECEDCGIIINVSKVDFISGNYPKLCPTCKLKPKRGTRKTLKEAMLEDENLDKKKSKKDNIDIGIADDE